MIIRNTKKRMSGTNTYNLETLLQYKEKEQNINKFYGPTPPTPPTLTHGKTSRTQATHEPTPPTPLTLFNRLSSNHYVG